MGGGQSGDHDGDGTWIITFLRGKKLHSNKETLLSNKNNNHFIEKTIKLKATAYIQWSLTFSSTS